MKKSNKLFIDLVRVISETNGINLRDTLLLMANSGLVATDQKSVKLIKDFIKLLARYQNDEKHENELLKHPISELLYKFFKSFPIRYREEHIHLTGSLPPEFIFKHIQQLLRGKNKKWYEYKIKSVYGPKSLPIKNVQDVEKLITISEGEKFAQYLEKLYLGKLILTNKKIHSEAAYALANDLYKKYNIGSVRLKYTFSRGSGMKGEELKNKPLSPEDVTVGLFQGFQKFKNEHQDFKFFLSPSFRKEKDYFQTEKFSSKQADFNWQIQQLIDIMKKYPKIAKHITDVDTVGNEAELYQKKHFKPMRFGFRKLQQMGLSLNSHHGEVWHTLNKGIQAVDNAMNIWRIDTLEHGLSLGINPNYYFHSLFERILSANAKKIKINPKNHDGKELNDMDWGENSYIKEKLINGKTLNKQEIYKFTKIKYFTALEVEHYQHDVLNRMIDKGITLTSLPTSNLKLTSHIPDFKHHPFSWWERKNITQAIGTDNYVALNTNFIKEMLLLLYADTKGLKITKLLMVATGEYRRAYLSNKLWQMRKKIVK